MQRHVINFDRSLNVLPDDLMSINELCAKYPYYTYSYLYKWSVWAKKLGLDYITPYYTGGLKLSEKDVLDFDKRRTELKYGRN